MCPCLPSGACPTQKIRVRFFHAFFVFLLFLIVTLSFRPAIYSPHCPTRYGDFCDFCISSFSDPDPLFLSPVFLSALELCVRFFFAPRRPVPCVLCMLRPLQDKFQDKYPELKFEQWRSKVGAFGVTGDAQLNPIENLRYLYIVQILLLNITVRSNQKRLRSTSHRKPPLFPFLPLASFFCRLTGCERVSCSPASALSIWKPSAPASLRYILKPLPAPIPPPPVTCCLFFFFSFFLAPATGCERVSCSRRSR